MNEMNSDKDYLVEDVQEEYMAKGLSRIDIEEKFKQAIFDVVEDSERILLEIDDFSIYLSKGEDELYKNESKYPFLLRIWSGDVYDQEHVEGLTHLTQDLKATYQNVASEDSFVEFVKKNYLG